MLEVQAAAGSVGVGKLINAGFKVSYYLPTEKAISCSTEHLQSPECLEFAKMVKNALKVGFTTLSFDIRGLNFVRQMQLPPYIELAVWDLDANLEDLIAKDDLQQFSWFIVPFKSRYNH